MTRRLRAVSTCLLALALGACAALPNDAPVVEQLDNDTGVTIARLGKPLELYRDTFMVDPAGRFAFIAPFETDQMGARELYLWLAIPVDLDAATSPTVEVDGVALELAPPGHDAKFAGLAHTPYKIPTPWSSMYYYKIDKGVIEKLAGAGGIALRVLESTKSGPVKTVFSATTKGDARLREFAAR